MISEKQVRLFTKRVFNAKRDGGAQIYVMCMCVLLLFVVLFSVLNDYKRLYITSDSVDDALVTALVSACVYNREEEALSGATVMYRTVTPVNARIPIDLIIPGYDDASGNVTVTEDERDIINGMDIMDPLNDYYLNNCYDKFLRNLKNNLKLDDSMICSMSGIDGMVTISEFSVYNKFYNLDESGEQADFRFVKYTYAGVGVWMMTSYMPNTYPTCYNSLDHTNYTIVESSVAATLDFQVLATRYNNSGGEIAKTGSVAPVTYSRVVDVVNLP